MIDRVIIVIDNLNPFLSLSFMVTFSYIWESKIYPVYVRTLRSSRILDHLSIHEKDTQGDCQLEYCYGLGEKTRILLLYELLNTSLKII